MADQVIDSVLSGLLDAETALRKKAEADAASARLSLVRTAQILAADWLEELGRRNATPDIRSMADMVTERAVALRASVDRCTNFEKVQALEQENRELRISRDAAIRERDALRARLDSLQRTLESSQQRDERKSQDTRTQKPSQPRQFARQIQQAQPRQTLQVRLSQPPEPPPPPDLPFEVIGVFEDQSQSTDITIAEPPWYQDWVNKSDKWAKEALRLIGNGMYLRKDLAVALAELKGVSSSNSATINSAINSLTQAKFIEVTELPRERAGNVGYAIRLTPLGKEAYQIAFVEIPVKSDFDKLRSSSSSDIHTLLITKAMDYLRAEGWEIGEQVQIGTANGTHKPDITAAKNGQTFHFEVERHTNKADRDTKWQNVVEVNQGNIFVFCENNAGLNVIHSEINRSLGSGLDFVNVLLSNIQLLDRGERADDGGLWHRQKIRCPDLLESHIYSL